MSVEYTNRKGDRYYLHHGITPKGKTKYYFSKKKIGKLAESIPSGYEIYENPNAQVFLRCISKKDITDEEKAVVEKGVRRYANLENFQVDVKKNSIIVYPEFESFCKISLKNRLKRSKIKGVSKQNQK